MTRRRRLIFDLPGLTAALKAKGWPPHQVLSEFAPKRVCYCVETLFSHDQAANPGAAPDESSVSEAGLHLGLESGYRYEAGERRVRCNIDTLMKYYVALGEQAVTDEVF